MTDNSKFWYLKFHGRGMARLKSAVDLTGESLKSPRSGCLARGHGMSKPKVSADEQLCWGNTTL